MPYDEENPPGTDYMEIPEELQTLSRQVIGAAIEVHRRLGPGMPEEACEGAMCIELTKRAIPFERQKIVEIRYHGVVVARAKFDLLVAGKLIVEIKSCETLAPVHRLQVLAYMRILKQPMGLLINFNVPILKQGIRRIIDTYPA